MEKHGFDIYINDDSKIIILGSFPSVKSREQGFYYMHKSNRFYKVLCSIFNDNKFLSNNIEEKKEALKKYNIALYDVIEECEINLSDDNSIKNAKPINLDLILKKYPIEIIVINGGKAKELFIKYFSYVKVKTVFLPSTSARNASYTENRLIENWKILSKI